MKDCQDEDHLSLLLDPSETSCAVNTALNAIMPPGIAQEGENDPAPAKHSVERCFGKIRK